MYVHGAQGPQQWDPAVLGGEKHHVLPSQLDHAGGQGKDPLTCGENYSKNSLLAVSFFSGLKILELKQTFLEASRLLMMDKHPKEDLDL